MIIKRPHGQSVLLVRKRCPRFVFKLERRLKHGLRRIIFDEERIGRALDFKRQPPLIKKRYGFIYRLLSLVEHELSWADKNNFAHREIPQALKRFQIARLIAEAFANRRD